MDLKNLRAFAYGEIDESAFNEIQSADEPFDLEDEEYITECMGVAIRLYIQSELFNESAEELNAAVNETYDRLQNYLIGQGMINEASVTVHKNSNLVFLSPKAQIERLKKIHVLKLARAAKTNDYKKFKIGANLKKISMQKMLKQFGNKAEKLAKQTWNKVSHNAKVNATVSNAKKKKK